MKFLIPLLLIFLLSNALGYSQNFSGPESVEYDPVNNRYIVSNTTAGNLQAVIPGNNPTLFTAAVGAPYGLVIVDSTLYVNDNGDVLGFNLVSGLQTFTANVNGGFLNGLCADNNGHLFATDFSAKKIFKINLSDGSSNVFVNATVKTPNGILFDATNNRLLYCTWGSGVQVKAVSLADSSQTIVATTTLSNDDGIAMDNQGRVFISVWGTQSIYVFDSAFANPPQQIITGLSNPADIYYNLLNDTLAVPNSSNNTVNFYNMSYILSLPVVNHVAGDYVRTFLNGSGVNIEWKIESKTATQLSLYSMMGTLLSSEAISSSGLKVVEPGSLATGIYFAEIVSGDKKIVEKFFISSGK